jgi:hypothetical protein
MRILLISNKILIKELLEQLELVVTGVWHW